MGNTGVLLLNFGGPANAGEVTPFLRSLLGDPEVIHLPTFLRVPFAYMATACRQRIATERYRLIGGGSPLNATTQKQAEALAARLETVPVRVGLRYASPTIADGLTALAEAGATRVIALPLYPQYSGTTTGSASRELERAARQLREIEIRVVHHWYDHPAFVSAVQGLIVESLSNFPDPPDLPHLLFSAHGLPLKQIERGDPYQEQMEHCVELIREGLAGVSSHSLSYQSRFGRAKWLGPSTGDEIRRLRDSGVRRILVCPISFVCDHLDTLYEIDIHYCGLAQALGVEQFERMESLNCRPAFIDALAQIVSDQMRPDDEG